MTQPEAIKMLKEEKEIVCLDQQAYTMFLALGLALMYQGVWPIAKLIKPREEGR